MMSKHMFDIWQEHSYVLSLIAISNKATEKALVWLGGRVEIAAELPGPKQAPARMIRTFSIPWSSIKS